MSNFLYRFYPKNIKNFCPYVYIIDNLKKEIIEQSFEHSAGSEKPNFGSKSNNCSKNQSEDGTARIVSYFHATATLMFPILTTGMLAPGLPSVIMIRVSSVYHQC